jgi:hypothetical protein
MDKKKHEKQREIIKALFVWLNLFVIKICILDLDQKLLSMNLKPTIKIRKSKEKLKRLIN